MRPRRPWTPGLRPLAAALALATAAAAQDTDWTEPPAGGEPVEPELVLTHEGLRGFPVAGEPDDTKRLGALVVEVRAASGGGGEARPATVVVRYRNRLVAAATGYRLGADLTHNGVLVEGWGGGDGCDYTSWRLRFAGERMELADERRLAVAGCGGG